MRDALARVSDETTRLSYYRKVPKSSDESWYADNSREADRDEGVRQGLIPLNAMVKRTDVDTTSSKGRYALHPDFVALLDPALVGQPLADAMANWQTTYLDAAARMRAALASTLSNHSVTVIHPQGGATVLPFGESPEIIKAVVEEFSKRFLSQPAVVWISDSAKRMFSDHKLNEILMIRLDATTLLPDVILVDMAPPKLRLIFVEVVSTDGAITEQRKQQFLDLLAESAAGYKTDDALFVTAYADRGARPVAKAMRELAWDTFAWFKSEPDRIVQFHRAQPPRVLSSL